MEIGVILKNGKNRLPMKKAVEVLRELADKYDSRLYFLRNNYNDKTSDTLLEEEFYKKIDILVSLGGDGTILQYAKEASKNNIPIFGINFGRVGFLTDVEKNEISLFEEVLKGNYTLEERMMLDAVFLEENDGEIKKIKESTALNDVVISRGISPKMLEIEIYVDNELTDTLRADGVIFSTPTGSTAYSLSAGGSVIDPASRLIEITPVCSHTLKSRPLIISEERKITLKHINPHELDFSYASTDGDEISPFLRSYTVEITVSQKKTTLIRVKNRNFYSVLKEKL